MTTSRLSEIDLARFCTLPVGDELDRALRSYNTGGGAWSYDPARNSTADLVGAQPALFGLDVPRAPWKSLEAQVTRACNRGADQILANVEVSKLLYDYSEKHSWIARAFELSSMPIGRGEKVRYWCDVIMDDGDGPFVSFHDHRRNGGVTNAEIARVVHSMQKSWIDARHPDLEGVRLAVIRFPASKKVRSITPSFSDGSGLLGYDELSARVEAVYSSWVRVSTEKLAERRKRG